MNHPSATESGLSWFWVIEYLAKCEQVKPPHLHAILDEAPELPDDLGKKMRETVSLRCLEELLNPKNRAMNDASSSPGSKAQFGASWSCEDVLQCILNGGSTYDLTEAANEVSKWDLQSYVLQKRASMIKTALQQLKDDVLEGAFAWAASVNELIGLANINRFDRTSEDGIRNNKNTSLSDGGGASGPRTGAERSSVSQTTLHVDQPLGGGANISISLPSKRNRADLSNENLEEDSHENQCNDEDDACNPNLGSRKQRQCDPNVREDRGTVSVSQKEILVSRRTDECAERDVVNLVQDQLEGADEGRVLEGDTRGGVQPTNRDVLLDGVEQGISVDDPLRNNENTSLPDQGEANVSTTGAKRNLVSPTTVHVDQPLDGGANISISLPAKRNRADLSAENLEEDSLENQCNDEDDACNCNLGSKKHRLHNPSAREDGGMVSVSQKQILVSRRTDECAERDVVNSVQDQLGGAEEGQVLEGDTTGGVQPRTGDVLLDGVEPGISVDDHMCSHDSCLVSETKNCESADTLKGRQTSSKSLEDYMDRSGREEMLGDSDGDQEEMVNLAMKKHEFLNSQSQCPSTHNSLAKAAWTDQYVCMKCNEGGDQLLECHTTSCPLVVHVNCVGSSVTFDDKGNFYCPFCAYSVAISEYLDAKKEASRTRKDLSAFICAGFEHQQENFYGLKENQPGHGRDEIGNVNGRLENNHGFPGKVSDEKQNDLPPRCMGVDAREEEETVTCRPSEISGEEPNMFELERAASGQRQVEENMVQECPSGQLFEGEENRLLADCLYVDGSIPDCDTEIDLGNEKKVEVRNDSDVSKGITDQPDEGMYPNFRAEETSEDEDNEANDSDYIISFRRQINQEDCSEDNQFRQKEALSVVREEQILEDPEQPSPPSPMSQPAPTMKLPAEQIGSSSQPLPSKHDSRLAPRRRRCLKTYASSVLRRSARIRVFDQSSRERLVKLW